MCDPMRVHVITSFGGLLRLSSFPNVLGRAAPFAGGTTSGFRARRLAPHNGQPPVRAVVDYILQPKLWLPRLSYSQFSLSQYRL